jgi:hypothetical protein
LPPRVAGIPRSPDAMAAVTRRRSLGDNRRAALSSARRLALAAHR